jgi:hypothetical protein
MSDKRGVKHKGRIYATIVGLVFVANLLLNALVVFINYPTEAHRSVARHIDAASLQMFNGGDFAKIMESEEYKKVVESSEAQYTNLATFYTLVFSFLVSVAILGAVYYYLRKHRITNKPVWVTVLLVSLGGLLPLIITAFGTAMYLGTQMPGIGHIIFMLFIGLVMAPLVNAVITKIFDWHYNRKNSLVIE